MKTITSFKSTIKNITTDKLNIILDSYINILTSAEGKIETKTYNRYLSISPSVRENYESLLSELSYAKSYVNYLNTVNPGLLAQYNMGMCEDFYYGSKREVVEAECVVDQIQRKIVNMEEKSQSLLDKDIRRYILGCNGKDMINLIKKELSRRQCTTQQTNEK